MGVIVFNPADLDFRYHPVVRRRVLPPYHAGVVDPIRRPVDLSGSVYRAQAFPLPRGRLAASGDFRAIRRLMTDRPHTFTVQSSDNRRLAVALVADESVFGVELDDEHLTVRTSQFADFTRAAPRIAKAEGITLQEVLPTDESLESVFSYLVKR